MIIGHKKQLEFLEKSYRLGKISHAYLFSGQSGLGKKNVAKEFIKIILCQGDKKPCEKCFSCLQIEKNLHPDLTIVGSQEGDIKIAQIRELSWKLGLKPYIGQYKAAIIDEAEKMGQESANALLKTLEEPSGQAVLILVSEHPESLPQTIVSRTQIIKFFQVPKEEMEKYLKEIKIPETKILELINLSRGKPGKLINFISDPKKIEEEKERIKEIELLIKSDLTNRFKYVKNIIDKEINITEILEEWTEYFREILLEKRKTDYTKTKIHKIIKTIETISQLIKTTNVNTKLALEMIMLEL